MGSWGGYVLGEFIFFCAGGLREIAMYYSERNLFIDIQKTSVNRNRDSDHIGIGGLGIG